MKELTKAEEQVMQILWTRKKSFVKEILEDMPEPKPAYNTVSTIIRILENKGFVDHEVFGKSHRYYPKVAKEDYRAFSAEQLMKGYFDASPSSMLSFFLKEKSLNSGDLDEMLKMIEEAKNKKK